MVSSDAQIDEYNATQYELDMSDSIGIYCIEHFYDMGDQRIYIKRVSGDIDAKRAAIYCQFKCEEWFGSEKMLTNLGVASLLITFYGYQHYRMAPGTKIDMHADRVFFCGDNYKELIGDQTLYREKLREYMESHVIPDNDLDKAANKKPNEIEEATVTQPADGVEVCCIYHLYDAGNQRIFLASGEGSVKARDAALFLQFKAEQIFGENAWISNLGIASLMCQFYGFQQCGETEIADIIDMYSDREYATSTDIYEALMLKTELQRDNLKEQIKFFLRPLE
jgi:uncharacterized cysteine cluster protein YcgN (CxxCxxCC family)